MDITVFGRGCSRCDSTVDRITREAAALGVEIFLSKVTDEVQIVQQGIMSTPAVMVDGKLVHAGGIPSIDAVQSWLKGV